MTAKKDIENLEGQHSRLGVKCSILDVTKDARQLAMRQMVSRLIAEEKASLYPQ
jgi:hypothetical protein